jgi:hypothetical protein
MIDISRMKLKTNILTLVAILFGLSCAVAQTRIDVLQKSISQRRNMVSIESVDPSTIAIHRADNGETLFKSIAEEKSTSLPNLVIDLNALDTTATYSQYRFWGEIPVANAWKGITIGDLDRNGKKEVYGASKSTFGATIQSGIFEYQSDSTLKLVHQVPDSVRTGLAYADVDGDGLYDVVWMIVSYSINNLILLTQQDAHSLPTKFKSFFDTVNTSGQPRRVTFYDINSDGRTEMIYYVDGGGGIFPPSNQIAVYNKAREKFEVVYYNRPNHYSAGFVFGDFDQDGKQNIANGGIEGELFIYEHVAGNDYSVKLADTVPTKNAYLSCMTHDLDGNGKPELWMGGDFFSNGIGITRLVAYEAVGDDKYERKYQIDINGVFSFFAGMMVAADLDNDGKEEIVVCVDQHVLVFKNTGGNNYALWYMKRNDLAAAGENSVYYEVTVSDIDSDGTPEIIIGMDLLDQYKGIRYFSNVYKLNSTMGIERPEGKQVPSVFDVFQNYPNPFNPSTTITYYIPNSDRVNVSIFDVLGRLIAVLVDGAEQHGTHKVTWNAQNQHSGVYFARVQLGGNTIVKKMLLLK